MADTTDENCLLFRVYGAGAMSHGTFTIVSVAQNLSSCVKSAVFAERRASSFSAYGPLFAVRGMASVGVMVA